LEIPKWEALVVMFVLIAAAFALTSSGQTVSHIASQVVPGSFATGLYHFVSNLNVSNTLFVTGNINMTGTIYNPSNLYMIVGNLISLVSSGNIELNATAGQIDLNAPDVYINNTHILNYSDDSAPLEIYSGNSTPIPCPTGFGLAYYGWTYAGIGRMYAEDALLGGDLSCFQNDSLINDSLWSEGSWASPNLGGWLGASTIIWWLVNETAGADNNLTACTVCHPNGGEYVNVYTSDSTGGTLVTCPAGFSNLFSTDGYVYAGGGQSTAGLGQSALTGGSVECVANIPDYISTVDLSLPGSGTYPAFWLASGGHYSRCNICYRPSVIN
jgi:hypothetical protein